MQVRLEKWQVERLKDTGHGAKIIRYAYERYKRGDFEKHIKVAQINQKAKNREIVPQFQPYSIRDRLPVSDAVLRAILALHWQYPDKERGKELQAEIDRLDGQIEEYFRSYSGMSYITE